MKPLISLVPTGGTISEYTTEAGAVPLKGHEDRWLTHVSDMGVDVKVKRPPVEKGSANIVPEDWKKIAEAVDEAIREGAHGVVVLHGTDTMHYTASALSFMMKGLGVPVVMTGSMIPGADPRSDAPFNLRNALTVAAHSDLAEVCVVFSADRKNSRGMIIRGCRAKKIHSTGLNAFASINIPPIGYVKDGKISYSQVKRRKRGVRPFELSLDLDPRVVLVKQHPAMTVEILRRFLEGASGAVLEGTGAGHIRTELQEVIASFGGPVVMSTQAIYGGVRWGLYATDKVYLDTKNVIPAGDMTSEAALVKLMWALRQPGDVSSTMLKDLAGERTEPGLREE